MLSKFRFSVVLAVLAVLTACQDAKPVHVVLDGIARTGAEPMLMLTDELEPMADPTYVHKKRDLYDCEHVVAPWFQKYNDFLEKSTSGRLIIRVITV